MRPERAIVRHWQLVLLACTFSVLVGALPEGAGATLDAQRDAPTQEADMPQRMPAGGTIRTSSAHRAAHRVERDATAGAGVVVTVGTAAALLEALVERRPTARAGRAPRPRRPLPPT